MTREQIPEGHRTEGNEKMNKFLVMVYSPKLSGKARKFSGNYRGIRVVETTDGLRPISVNAKNVARVIQEYGAVNIGKTAKSEGRRVLLEATKLAEQLNNQTAAEAAGGEP